MPLTQHPRWPAQRTADRRGDLCDLPLSDVSVLAAVAEAGERLEPSVAALGQAMVAAPLAHADETGMRGEGKLHWRHVLATGWLSWIGLHAPRGQKAFEAPERLAHFRTL